METNTSLRTLMFNDKIDTPNLADFLRVKQDNNNLAGLTLGAVLSNKRESSSSPVHHSNTTLLDIIRDDPNSSTRKTKKWKHFRNKLRLKPNISIQHHNNPITPVGGAEEISVSGSTSRILDETAESNGEEIGLELEDQPARMSLMALLTENDGDESAYMMEDGDEEEDELDDDDDNGVAGADADASSVAVAVAGEYNNCCVCMVRHKGAAFIPCGHTFCRLCSRELWVQRGNCPLCNNFILEVLDIF
ncbi:uncharacterized protein LOC129881667 [Solanum dulcamara]|uniref:uncharacterized protein LOC129881667 n=1 Tax=Solanum dulcamara TaxID=45834 RepID=UPI0024850DC8|nr:uncharacterized protein LOC129881667 [Solanum dulcamara]